MIKTLRWRLTVWYLVSFAALLLLFSVLLYGVLARSLERRLDESLTAEVNTVTALMKDELEEVHGDASLAARNVIEELQFRGSIIAMLEGGAILASSSPGELPAAPRGEAVEAVPRWGRRGARATARTFAYDGQSLTVLALEPLDSLASSLQALRETFAVAIPLILGLAGIGGYLLTKRGLAPLGSVIQQTRQIGGENLHSRIEIGNAAEELATLAASFNELLSRLDQSFETMRRFVQDASHELRTPLAVIRGEADVVLSRERSAAEYRESLATIQQETQRLSRLVDDLLNLARADAGRVQLRMEELYLNDLLGECCRSVQPLAAARQIELECRCAGDIAFRGDEGLLRRMVINLLDNAVRYTPPGGKVQASLEAQGADVRIRVADTGIGIAPEASHRVFERFYRADPSRNREQDGFGLGLSIVKWIAESHHGQVELESKPGSGSTFTVHLARQ